MKKIFNTTLDQVVIRAFTHKPLHSMDIAALSDCNNLLPAEASNAEIGRAAKLVLRTFNARLHPRDRSDVDGYKDRSYYNGGIDGMTARATIRCATPLPILVDDFDYYVLTITLCTAIQYLSTQSSSTIGLLGVDYFMQCGVFRRTVMMVINEYVIDQLNAIVICALDNLTKQKGIRAEGDYFFDEVNQEKIKSTVRVSGYRVTVTGSVLVDSPYSSVATIEYDKKSRKFIEDTAILVRSSIDIKHQQRYVLISMSKADSCCIIHSGDVKPTLDADITRNIRFLVAVNLNYINMLLRNNDVDSLIDLAEEIASAEAKIVISHIRKD